MAKKPLTKNQKTINGLLGKIKEPQPINNDVLSQSELARLLNWFRIYGNEQKLIYYFEVYCKDSNYNLSHVHTSSFITYGSLIRIKEIGFNIKDSDFNKVVEFCESNSKQSKQSLKNAKKVTTEINYDYWREDIEYGCDCALLNKDYTHNYETSKQNIKKCIVYIESQLQVIENDYKEKCYSSKDYKTLKSYFNNLLTYYTGINKVKTRVNISTNKTTIVKNVKFNNDSHSFIETKIYPLDVVGKKKLYTYDIKRNKLTMYHSVIGGFTFTGTTLKNIDMDKSFSKTLSDTKNLSQQISQLNKLFRTLKRKPSEPSPRFNNDTIILCVS